MSAIETFTRMLEQGTDNALLRYSLANEYLKLNDAEKAIKHLEKALEFNPTYSAAWKVYAKALNENKQKDEAIKAYEQGIQIAEKNGDKQAVKEMQVFLKRLQKS